MKISLSLTLLSSETIQEFALYYTLTNGESVKIANLPLSATHYNWIVPSVDVKDARLKLIAKDALNRVAESFSDTFDIRSSGPNLTITSPAVDHSKGNDITITGTCETGYAIATEQEGDSGLSFPNTVNCNNGTWSVKALSSVDGTRKLIFSQVGDFNLSKKVSMIWIRDGVAPTILSNTMTIANGATFVNTNFIPVVFQAQDTSSKITHLCVQYNTVTSVSAPPALDHSCWIHVENAEQPNISPAKAIQVSNFIYRIGYTAGTYYVRVFVRDESDNISAPVEKSLAYDPGLPPVLENVYASKISNLFGLPSHANAAIAQNAPVYIRWKLSSTNGLSANPIRLYYTVDDEIYTAINESVGDSAQGCPLQDASHPGFSTGCFAWPSPISTGTFFKIRVAAEDRNGNITFASTNLLNSPFRSIAGNTEDGVGASASAALLFNVNFGFEATDVGSFVITKGGKVFFRDAKRGILTIDPTTGVLKSFIPYHPSADTSYEGAVSGAKVRSPIKIALDFSSQGGLLIWDYDRIRRVNLDTMVISTFIGGNGDSFEPKPSKDKYNVLVPLIPLPNGDVLFQSENYLSRTSKMRVYRKGTNSFTSILANGVGNSKYPSEDIATCETPYLDTTKPCSLTNYVAAYDPATSQLKTVLVTVKHYKVGGEDNPVSQLNPVTGTATGPHVLPASNGIYTTGRDGNIYLVGASKGVLSRFNLGTNQWDAVLGTGAQGHCLDGTPALQCPTHLKDAFIDASQNIYFMDAGQMRTIDGQGKVVTLFGQAAGFGDGKMATSARFGRINALTQSDNGKIQLIDSADLKIREFAKDGPIEVIAGNSSNAIPALGQPANTQPILVNASGRDRDLFATDPTTGDIFFHRGPKNIARLKRLTNEWVDVVTNLPGGYVPGVLAITNGTLLVHTNRFDSTTGLQSDAKLFLIDSTAQTSTEFAGVLGASNNTPCPNGTHRTSCALTNVYGQGLSGAYYDSAINAWLLLQKETPIVRMVGAGTSDAFQTRATLPVNATSFVPVKKTVAGAPKEFVYYCDQYGRLHEMQLAPTPGDTILPILITGIQCTGQKMLYRQSDDTLIFPYLQNGTYGVADYKLP